MIAHQQKPPVCLFYLRGSCRHGSECRFSHDANDCGNFSSTESAKPGKGSWCSRAGTQSVENDTTTSRKKLQDNKPRGQIPFIPCRFFAAGNCVRGESCIYAHVTPTPNYASKDVTSSRQRVIATGSEENSTVDALQKLTISDDTKPTNEETITKTMGSTLSVTFGPGLEILDIASASSTPIITIHNLPPNASSITVQKLFTNFHGPPPTLDAIRVIAVEGATYATVNLVSSSIAESLAKTMDGFLFEDSPLAVRVYQPKVGLSSISQSATRVSCTWFAPTRLAFIENKRWREDEVERVVAKNEGHKIRGRKIHCELVSGTVESYGRGSLRRIIKKNIMVSSLPLDTVTEDLVRVFHAKSPTEISLRAPNFRHPTGKTMAYILSLFDVPGSGTSVDGYDVVSPPNAPKTKVIIRFKSAESATKAVKDFHMKKQAFLGNSPLFIQPIVTASFKVLGGVYQVISKDLKKLVAGLSGKGAHVRIFGAEAVKPNALVTIRITGADRKEVSDIKTKVGALVRGLVCLEEKDAGVPLWDPHFTTDAGVKQAKEINEATGAYVYCDKNKSQLVVFGPEANRRKAMQRLHSIVKELTSGQIHEMSLSADLWKCVMRTGFARVQSQLRIPNEGHLNIDIVRRLVIFRGSAEQAAAVVAALKADNDASLPEPSSPDDGPDCPICLCPADTPTTLPTCSHTYCGSCLSSYLASLASTRAFPIRCLAESCSSLLPLSLLPPTLLPTAFTDHVRRHPTEYANCPTPNCPTIYKPTSTSTSSTSAKSSSTVFTCVECLTTVCTSCQAPSHEGLTCAQYKSSGDDGLSDELSDKWMAKNGVKKCPKCSTQIMKSDGCNHMTCPGCKIHICWVCLKTFETGELVYAHLNRVHGGIWVEDDILN